MHEVEVHTRGRVFRGWKNVQLSRSLESLTGTFQLEVTAPAVDQETVPSLERFIREERLYFLVGSNLDIYVDGEKWMTGFVDQMDQSISGSDSSIVVRGRDITGDLVDSSQDVRPYQINAKTLKQIAERLVGPHGIEVIDYQGNLEPIQFFSLSLGETVFSALERAARYYAAILQTSSEGQLVIEDPGRLQSRDALREGDNIKSMQFSSDFSDRFTEYKILSSSVARFDYHTDAIFHREASARDEAFEDLIEDRRRIKVMTPESQILEDEVNFDEQRVQWEASVRAAESSSIVVETVGWRDGPAENRAPSGELWWPNMMVDVSIPSFNISDRLLISEVDLSQDENGSVATLTLRRRDAFVPQPFVPSEFEITNQFGLSE